MADMPGNDDCRILVVDDKEDVCRAIECLLEPEGYTVHTAQKVEVGIHALNGAQKAGRPYAVALVDMRFENYPGSEEERANAGRQVVTAALAVPSTEVIVMTGRGEIGSAVRLMKDGVFTYLEKGRGGEGMPEMPMQVRRALEHRALRQHADETDGKLGGVAEKLRRLGEEIRESAAALEQVVRTRDGSLAARGTCDRGPLDTHAPAYLGDLELMAFSSRLDQSRNDLPHARFVAHAAPVGPDELVVLRRWSSHTPLAGSALGGGYFVRWHGKGIALDPGHTFLTSFSNAFGPTDTAPLCLNDIDLVIASHDHPDHCGDLANLLALVYAYRRQGAGEGAAPARPIDLVVSKGVHDKHRVPLGGSGAEQIFRVHIAEPPCTVRKVVDTDIEVTYGLSLQCISTDHHEIVGTKTGFGVRIASSSHDTSLPFVFCDTGDTAYDESLCKQYEGADILLVHVGTLEKFPEENGGRGEHLCFDGTVRLLRGLTTKPRLVLLGEWGEEFAVPGYRERFTTFVKKHAGLDGVPILPADLGMRIRIPDCSVWCSNTQSFEPPGKVWVRDPIGQSLEYFAETGSA